MGSLGRVLEPVTPRVVVPSRWCTADVGHAEAHGAEQAAGALAARKSRQTGDERVVDSSAVNRGAVAQDVEEAQDEGRRWVLLSLVFGSRGPGHKATVGPRREASPARRGEPERLSRGENGRAESALLSRLEFRVEKFPKTPAHGLEKPFAVVLVTELYPGPSVAGEPFARCPLAGLGDKVAPTPGPRRNRGPRVMSPRARLDRRVACPT